MKKHILKKEPGIYKIVHDPTGYTYVGASKDILARFYQHKGKMISGRHNCYELNEHAKKYGVDSFSFEVIEYCPVSELKKKESYYIKTLNPYYNNFGLAQKKPKCKKNNITGCYLTDEVKMKMRKYQGSFQFHMGQKISQTEVINLALHFFLSLDHEWEHEEKMKYILVPTEKNI